jgi:hypothetical protein
MNNKYLQIIQVLKEQAVAVQQPITPPGAQFVYRQSRSKNMIQSVSAEEAAKEADRLALAAQDPKEKQKYQIQAMQYRQRAQQYRSLGK